MTYVILKLIKGGVPIRWEKVTNMKMIYPDISFLNSDPYGLKDSDIISVRHTKRINVQYNASIWKGYRTSFIHAYNGDLKGFKKFCKEFMKKRVWDKQNVQKKNREV